MRFIHTADWQIGKPFARVSDEHKRALVRQARLEALLRIASLAQQQQAELVLVAGDLFDSPSADNKTVSALCAAVGEIRVPVVAIPGNHDHGGPGSVWEQDFFLRERADLAPNLVVLAEEAPYELDCAVILPCPLRRRATITDPTAWLRSPGVYAALPSDKPRIVLAHGSTESFGGEWDDEIDEAPSTNLLDVDRIPRAEVDYIALGDWHGTKQVGPKAWYSGTPEPDRFTKSGDHDPGNVLVVEVRRGGVPDVVRICTKTLSWLELSFDFAGADSLSAFEEQLDSLLEQRTGRDLLRLSLGGFVSLDASSRLEEIVARLEARLLRLKLVDRTVTVPSDEEVEALARSATDPLIARVAARLIERSSDDEEDAAVARIALRELYAAWRQEGGV